METSVIRDEWEKLLAIEIGDLDCRKILNNFTRIKTGEGFLKKLDFPPIVQTSKYLGSSKQMVLEGVKTVRFSIDSAVKQRKERSGALGQVQNKIKHGMMVYTDTNPNNSWIRIFKVKYVGKDGKKRLLRTNINFTIPIHIDKAERMVGTIKAYGQAIEALINLLLIDYKYRLVSKKIMTTEKNKNNCLKEIDKALS